MACKRAGEKDEETIFSRVLQTRPHAWPNSLMVELADNLLTVQVASYRPWADSMRRNSPSDLSLAYTCETTEGRARSISEFVERLVAHYWFDDCVRRHFPDLAAGPRSDTPARTTDTRASSLADMGYFDVRFQGQSGHSFLHRTCPLMTQSGHC